MFENISNKISSLKIIPVVKLWDSLQAVKLAEALVSGGINAMEITFRTVEGNEGYAKIADCINTISKEFPGMLLGAGTVINPSLAEIAMESGAQFIVSPGFNVATVDYCIKNEIPVYPGVNNPSQVEEALMHKLELLKFFPAEVSGGTRMLKALSGPFPQVKFIATGGISKSNLREYLDCKNVAAAGGTWMVEENLIREEKWDVIKSLSEEAVKIAGV